MTSFDEIDLDQFDFSKRGDILKFIDYFIEFMNKITDKELNSKSTPIDKKMKALTNMKNFLIETEDYERCALLQKIEDRLHE